MRRRRCRRACTTPAASASSARRSRCRPSAGRCSTSRAIARTARPIGSERAHAVLMAGLIGGADNRFSRVGARVHDVHHPAWQAEVDVLLDGAGDRIAFLTLAQGRERRRRRALPRACRAIAPRSSGSRAAIPVSVLIETPGAVHDAWAIAALPGIVSLDFGLMDFVSAHYGAIPGDAMVSPGQFDHPLVRRAKCEIAAAALAHGVVAAPQRHPRARRPRASPSPTRAAPATSSATSACGASIRRRSTPIVAAMRPAAPEVEKAAGDPGLRRRTPTGDRCASTASCTIARRIARRGRCCSAPTPQACPCRRVRLPISHRRERQLKNRRFAMTPCAPACAAFVGKMTP